MQTYSLAQVQVN